MQQEEAFNLLKMGKNIFLTGAAGSGKTYLLNKYIHYLKDNNVGVAVTASTGVAATHLQGTTIHSWSGIGVKDALSEKELEKLLQDGRIKRNYKKTKVLIIDEISMLHKHQLDMIDEVARLILNSQEAFGGLQVVLCGDFFQLPPVFSRFHVEEKYFAFEAASWQQGNFYVCYLNEQHRQADDPLLNILNDIRNGTAGEHTKIPLRTRYKKEPEGATQATKLYSRNLNVDAINEQELANIPGDAKTFTMSTQGFHAVVESLKKTCLASAQLQLKIGAEVMFIKNDNAGRYVNGTRCVVVGFDRGEGWPMVKTYDDQTFIAYPEEWKFEENGIVRAIISQVPLRLAWAITIHKSQGMTLDAAEIDLGDAFEPGMGYVALSRVRSLNGLKLMNLNEMALKVHPKILTHDQVFKENSENSIQYLQTMTQEALEKYHQYILVERFGANKLKTNITCNKKSKKTKVATHLKTRKLLGERLSIESIAAKRNVSLGTILSHIEKLKGLKQIDYNFIKYLKDSMPQQDFDVIFKELQNSVDGQLRPIYDKFKQRYSFMNIQLVRLFVGL